LPFLRRSVDAGKCPGTNHVQDFVVAEKIPGPIPPQDFFGLQGGHNTSLLQRIDRILKINVTHTQISDRLVHDLPIGQAVIDDSQRKVFRGKI